MKKTVIIGASTNPDRYSFKAAHKLHEHDYAICMVGPREGELLGEKIYTEKVLFSDVHTVTLYVSEKNQKEYYDYIISLKPQRVIFNPGTENEEFAELLKAQNIQVEIACTLVLLSINAY